MNIKQDLLNITRNYETLRQKDLTSSNRAVIDLLSMVAVELETTKMIQSMPHVSVDFSRGQGNLPVRPTFYIKDGRETTRGTRGVYIVLRVDTDSSSPHAGFLLALTQGREGVNNIKDPEEKAERVLRFRALASFVAEEHFSKTSRMEHRGFAYADESPFQDHITIARKYYRHADFSVKEFASDLEYLLQAYEAYVEHSVSLTDQERTYALRKIEIRLKQTQFQEQLWRKYKRCVVTGCDIRKTVDAAHIIPHSDEVNFDPVNGLLLRADIHRLFDGKLLKIDKKGIVHLDKEVQLDTFYSPLHQKDLSRIIDAKSLDILGTL